MKVACTVLNGESGSNAADLHNKFIVNMASKNLNRIKVVLADKQRTNKWLAEQLGKDKTTISKWCTNSSQPDLESLMKTAKLLNVEVTELLRTNVE